MKYFGRKHNAPMYEDTERVAVPEGSFCYHCDEMIIAGDDGIILSGCDQHPLHRACFLRGIFGSLAHIEKRCRCFVAGSDEGDPPGLTARQAAEAALAAFDRQVKIQ